MLKIRISYADQAELDIAIKKLEESFKILSISKPYKLRGNNCYSNIYLDVENKKG